MKEIKLLALLLIVLQINVNAQNDSVSFSNINKLGEVVIEEAKLSDEVIINTIQAFNLKDAADALNLTPSISLTTGGARNESVIYLRGFDLRSVPVFIDGVPVYVPYDGYVDLSRFTTYDVSRIDVSKGYSSIMYGANTIGGAINLISQKPTHKFELNSKLGVMSGRGYEASVSAGSRLGKFFVQGGFSILSREFMPLSADFDTSALETDYRRDQSYRKDWKAHFKLGYTPNKSDEYSLNYSYSHGSKGNPIYLGDDPYTKIRYWDWPYWDKQSVYLLSKTKISKNSNLQTRWYFDQFKNKLESFDDNTYSTQNKPYAFTSFYDDYTLGGNVLWLSQWNENNLFKATIQLKNDNHSEYNEGDPKINFADNTYFIGFEDIFQLTQKIKLIPGIAYTYRQSLMAQELVNGEISDYPYNYNDAFNAQLATFYKLNSNIELHATIAEKSRYATMKDRYSYKLGRAIPNPDLKSETSTNIELGTSVYLFKKLKFEPVYFYSHLQNTIQQVSNVEEDKYQMQNTGSSEFQGAEFSMIYQILKQVQLQMAYAYIQRKNLSNPDILFTDVPDHKFLTTLMINPFKDLQINLLAEFNSDRDNASDGSRVSKSFYVLNAQLSYQFKSLKAEFGINNLMDNNYTIQEGYPEMGRNLYFALFFRLNK
ncbi:MAG: TonB-dependent receptor [Bacteroidales bacterium]|nr:TonB-dependent receptor [Bacteroidales bacterium]